MCYALNPCTHADEYQLAINKKRMEVNMMELPQKLHIRLRIKHKVDDSPNMYIKYNTMHFTRTHTEK